MLRLAYSLLRPPRSGRAALREEAGQLRDGGDGGEGGRRGRGDVERAAERRSPIPNCGGGSIVSMTSITTATVGGGLYKHVHLLEGEQVVAETHANKKFFVPFATSMWGRLVLTNQRLIFLPLWLLPPSWPERPDCLHLGGVRRLERVTKPWYSMWWGLAETHWWIFTAEERQIRYHIAFGDQPFEEQLLALARHRGWEFQDKRTSITS